MFNGTQNKAKSKTLGGWRKYLEQIALKTLKTSIWRDFQGSLPPRKNSK